MKILALDSSGLVAVSYTHLILIKIIGVYLKRVDQCDQNIGLGIAEAIFVVGYGRRGYMDFFCKLVA